MDFYDAYGGTAPSGAFHISSSHGLQPYLFHCMCNIINKFWDGGAHGGDWVYCAAWEILQFQIHASPATWREGKRLRHFPWHKMQTCHCQPQEMGYEFAPPRGAGAGPLAACPQGSVQPVRPVLPPSLPDPRRQGTSLIVGWASQWGLAESKRIADGMTVLHQHE